MTEIQIITISRLIAAGYFFFAIYLFPLITVPVAIILLIGSAGTFFIKSWGRSCMLIALYLLLAITLLEILVSPFYITIKEIIFRGIFTAVPIIFFNISSVVAVFCGKKLIYSYREKNLYKK